MIITLILFLCFSSMAKCVATESSCHCSWSKNGYEKRTIRIIGGGDVEKQKYPFMAGLFDLDNDDLLESVQCGAAIINSLQLLTAAHCINSASNYSVVFGVSNLIKADKGNIRKVSLIDIHPEFDEGTLANDLAVLTLDSPMFFGSGGTAPVCLSLNKRRKRSQFRILGWGYTSNTSTSLNLQEVTVKEYNYLRCHRDGLTDSLKRKQFCTLTEDKGPCLGDSGGPVLQWFEDEKSRFELVGIVSKGPEDCRALPSVHTDIRNPEYMEWIKNKSKDYLCFG